MSYRQQPYEYYDPSIEPLRLAVMEKLTTGLGIAGVTSIAMIFADVNPIFLGLAFLGYIVSIIGYFFARNEDTINTLYYVFVGSTSVMLGFTLQVVASIPGGADIIFLTFAITGLTVGGVYYRAKTKMPDTAELGRKLMPLTLGFIVILIASWFIAFSNITYLLISIFGAALFSLWLYFDFARLFRGELRSPARMAWELYWDIYLIFRYILMILLQLARSRN